MRFIMTSEGERTHAPATKPTETTARRPRSTPQTRRRNDLPDTTTITIRSMTDNDRLRNKILDADPNRELHYSTPTLKRRILF
jgi:hypothetical protein